LQAGDFAATSQRSVVGGCAFAPNGMTNSTYVDVNGNQRFLSRFLYADLILNNQFKTGLARLPVNLLLEYENNLNAAAHPFDYTVKGAVADPVPPRTPVSASSRTLYMADISMGQQKKKNDIQFGYAFLREEQDAAIASWGESDQRAPTNIVQHRSMVCGGLLPIPLPRSLGGTAGRSIRSFRTPRWHRNCSSPIRPNHTSWLLAPRSPG